MIDILDLETRVGKLSFIFDKDNTLVGVLLNGECISNKLKFELEKNITNLDLFLYLQNQDDILTETRFNNWLDEFIYFT